VLRHGAFGAVKSAPAVHPQVGTTYAFRDYMWSATARI
jgi:hypothetical protein